jgi:acid phosphatase
MSDVQLSAGRDGSAGTFSKWWTRALPASVLIALLAVVGPVSILAAECPLKQPEPRIPPVTGPVIDIDRAVINIDKLKLQLLEYKEGKDGKPGNYEEDVKRVFDQAAIYVKQRVDEAKQSSDQSKLAVVLDIDETSLSNWPNLKANNFGFIKGGACFEQPTLACGFDDWILKSSAPAIPPALEFFKTVIATKSIAVFFITGRRESQRQATLWNLDSVGFEGWAALYTRPDDDHKDTIVPFKRVMREKIAHDGYKIIANIGDQLSDLDEGRSAECTFKVPNPFYFIP